MPVPENWLKKAIIKANVPKHTVIERVLETIGGWEQGRSRSTLHCSDVTQNSFCPRREAFYDMDGKEYGESMYVDAALRVTFDMGHATAKHLIERWSGEYVIGHWRCQHCGKEAWFCPQPSPAECSKAFFHRWRYREVVFTHPTLDLSGSIDAFFEVGVPQYVPVELKIVAPDEFEKLVAPLPEHRLRTALYLKLMAESGSPYSSKINTQEGRVLYVSRGYGKKNENHGGKILPFKEFVVNRDDDSIQDVINKTKQLWTYRHEGLMPSGICSTTSDKTAKGCSKCKECFSGDFPAQQPELETV